MIAFLAVAGVTAGFLLSQPTGLEVLEHRTACTPLTASDRAYLVHAEAALTEARSKIIEIGAPPPFSRERPMIEGLRLTVAAARQRLPFSTVLPHDPLACPVLQKAVWIDRERQELLIDYQSGIVITESLPSDPNIDWARLARSVGPDAAVGRARGSPALVIQASKQVNPASVGLVVAGVYVAVYSKYAPYPTGILIRVANSLR